MNLNKINKSHPISKILTKPVLEKEYLENRLSTCDLCKKYNTSRWSIKNLLNTYNIPQRNVKEATLLRIKLHPLSISKGKNHPNYGNRGKNAFAYKNGKTHNNKCKCGNIMSYHSKKCEQCMPHFDITKEFLIQEYVKNKKFPREIALIVGCSRGTISYKMKLFKIKPRKRSENQKLIFIKNPNLRKPGKDNPNYIDGRSSKKYYCKKCNKQICNSTVLRGKGMCQSCLAKERFSIPENTSGWIDGRSYEPYSTKFTIKLKAYIHKRDKYICQNKECNMTEEEHLIVYGTILHCHHIDYDKENASKDNLISLCIQCNTRANFNRDVWQTYYKKIIKETNNSLVLNLRSNYDNL